MGRTQQQKADELAGLNQDGSYVLPNAWDAGSAVITAQAGAKVIATTSGGVSWGNGLNDGQQMTRELAVSVIREIASAVDLPVSADIEGGYGPAPSDVAQTVWDIVAAGAVGINLEDSGNPAGGLYTDAEQAARISAARGAATEAGLPNLSINARTDVYLAGIGAPEGRYDETVRRARSYAEAGADTVFVPGLSDLEVIAKIADESPIPLNIMVGAGSPSVDELAKAGVRRVSLGAALPYAAYSLVLRAAREALEHGTYSELGNLEPWDEFGAGFRNR